MATRPEEIEVDTGYADEEGRIDWGDDDTIVVLEGSDEEEPRGDASDHGANLAEHIDPETLEKIAEDLLEKFERDRKQREAWERRFAKGLEIVGYVPEPDDDAPFPGACSVVYPLISEACIQFGARAIDELFPPAGPVKVITVGDRSREKDEQAERVQDYMNYQITEEDPGWFDEDERLLTYLPLYGMGWKKVYRDERLGTQTSRFVPGTDVYAPYSATSTATIPRLCHRYPMQPNDVKFEMLSGRWRRCELHEPPPVDEEDQTASQHAIDEAESADPESSEEDKIHWILEFWVDYDLPGYEHVSEDDQEPTGFALPYIMVIEEHSRKVLQITRNWREGDERFRKRMNLIPFRFLPGFGFYGHGFLHAIGALNEAATGALRALLDSAGFDNMRGGFVSEDVAGKISAGELRFGRGEYKIVKASSAELREGIWSPDRNPPSEALFKLLGMLVEAGKSWTSTTEAMTGSAPSTGPVGTMVALIEQGSKVFSGIHKRLHKAKRDEYRLLAELDGEYVPEEGYPYEIAGTGREIFAMDFSEAIDVLPVSDPNIFSAQQRIAMAQAVIEVAEVHPEMYDIREAHRRLLEALKVPDIDSVLLDQSVQPRRDPVTENMLMMTGQPVMAFPDQVHDAHLQVHMAFMRHPGFGGNPEAQKIVAEPMIAHMAEHAAFLYQQRMMRGAQLPYITSGVGGAEAPEEDMDPQMEGEIATRAAMASEAFMQMQGLPVMPDPEQQRLEAEREDRQAEMAMKQAELEIKRADLTLRQQAAQADIGLKQQTAQSDLTIKQQAAAAEEQRRQAAFVAEERRKEAEWIGEQERAQAEHEAKLKRQKEAAAAQARQTKAKAQVRPAKKEGSEK